MGARRLSIEQEKQLVQEYLNGESVESLCQKYGYKTKKSITDKVRKHTEDYELAIKQARQARRGWQYSFETIQNEFDAYFIGLLMTDGYLTSRGTDLGIDLIDEDCIKFLSEVIGKEYKTYASDRSSLTDKYNRQDRHRLVLSDSDLVEQAKRYGITANKTANLQGFALSNSESAFIPYLVRGIIDGDGCIFETSYGAPAVYIISQSKKFLEWVEELMTERLYFKHLRLRSTSDNLYRLETAHQEDILKLMALVYDKPYGMSRKYNKLRKTFRDYNRGSDCESKE